VDTSKVEIFRKKRLLLNNVLGYEKVRIYRAANHFCAKARVIASISLKKAGRKKQENRYSKDISL
jgi:hypothetical protein